MERVGRGWRLGLAVIALVVAITASTAVVTMMRFQSLPARTLSEGVSYVGDLFLLQVLFGSIAFLPFVAPLLLLCPSVTQLRRWPLLVIVSLVSPLPLLLDGTRGPHRLWVAATSGLALWEDAVALLSCLLYLALLRRQVLRVGGAAPK